MEIGTRIVTTVNKISNENLKEIVIPKGTIGTVCEIHPGYILVEIWGDKAPKGIEGVFDFELEEIKELPRLDRPEK